MIRSGGARRWLGRSVLVSLVGASPACDGSDGDDDGSVAPTCVEIDAQGCAPLYAPTFDDVLTRTLMPSCATGGGSCHANADAAGAADGGLFFDGADATHARLVADHGDASFVVAGDAACSDLIVRLLVDDAALRMPVGSSLSAGEICSVAQWIEQGAAR